MRFLSISGRVLLAGVCLFAAGAVRTHAASRIWDGGGADNNWLTAANWDAGIAPNDLLFFAGSTRLTPNNNTPANSAMPCITFNSGAGAFILSGNVINVTGGITNNSTSLQIINLDLALTATRNIEVVSAGSLTLGGVISGAGFGITKSGGGTLKLDVANTYTGATTIDAGTVKLGNATALGTTAAGTTVSSGAVLDLNGKTVGAEALTLNGTGISSGGALISISGTAASFSGTVSLSTSASVGGTGDITLSGVISGTGTLTKLGAGTLTLSGLNDYTGGTTISAGTLALGTSNVLANAGALTMSGGTFSNSGYSDALGALTNLSSSTIALGTGTTGTLTFASGSYTAGTLTVSNWTGMAGVSGTGNRIFVTAVPSATFLTNINFAGYQPGAIRLGSGEIVPNVGAWYNASWTNRIAIVIDRTKVSGPLTNFPALINLTNAALQASALASGNDLLFTSVDGTNKLDHEIESYTNSNGALVAWVEVPILSSTADTVLYLYYGNSASTNQQNAVGVWDSNYKGVWHLQQTPTGSAGDMADSTSGNNAGRSQTIAAGAQVAGRIGGSLTLDGTSDFISTATSFVNPTTVMVQGWVKTSSTAGKKVIGFENTQTSTAATASDRQIYFGTDGTARFGIYNTTTTTTDIGTSSSAVNNGQWHYLVGYRDNALGKVGLYVDGVLQGTPTTSSAIQSYTGWYRIGAFKVGPGWPGGGADGYFTGSVDEVRVSHFIRSSAWIATEYTNQGFPATFYSIGSAESVPPPTKLAITSVNSGSNPTAGTAFTVVVQAQDAGGTARNVTANTAVTLSLNTGSGTLGGTLTGTITAGTDFVTISGVTYNQAESAVAVTATRTSGDSLTAGNSSSFIVNGPVTAAQSTVSASPTSVVGNGTATSTITVTLKDANSNPVPGKTVTLAKSGGSSTLSAASGSSSASGVVTFTVTDMVAETTTYTATDTTDGIAITQTADITFTTIPWCNTSWTNRIALTIDHTKVSSTQTNFPVLIDITNASLQASVLSNGNDLLFTSEDGTSKLAHEIELYTNSTGRLVAWVNVPSLSSTVDTTLYLYYGNNAATNQQNATNVWDTNFKAVWHMHSASTPATDSTSNGKNAAQVNGVTFGASGKVDRATSFNSTTGQSLTNSLASLSSFTVSMWLYPISSDSYGSLIVESPSNGIQYRGAAAGADANKVTFYYSANHYNNTAMSTNAWHHLVVVNNAGAVTFYLDGNSDGTASGAPATALKFVGDNSSSESFGGSFDEMRVSSLARSASWIATEYNNQNSPATFYSVGSAQSVAPTKLAITSINSGSAPTVGAAFSVVVEAQDAGGTPRNVLADTAITLSVNTGSGTLGGTITGTITAGNNSVTISGVNYSKAENGVILTVTRTSGDSLTAGNSSSFNVSTAVLTVSSGLTANNKVYDGTNTATISSNTVVLAGVLAADMGNVSLSTNSYTATFASSTVGSGKTVTVSGLTLTGSAAGNYTLTQPSLSANITVATVTVSSGLTANNKVYDGTTTATISSNSVGLSGVIAGDAANAKLSTNGYTASFASATVGTGKTVTVSGLILTGSAAANYTLTQPSLSADIIAGAFTKLQILMPGETAAPGTASGKTGTPTVRTAGTAFSVTVNAVDANWNLINTNHTVGITSSDTNATLPASAALVAGTKTFSLTLKTVNAITLDNLSAGVAIVGAWNHSASTTGYWGEDYIYGAVVGNATNSVTFIPNLPAAGTYQVNVRWTSFANRATNAPMDVIHPAGTNTFVVNQTQNNGVWMPLLSTNFNAGTNAGLRLRTIGTSGFVVADAAQWIPTGTGPWTVTATDLTDGTKTANNSPATPVTPGAFAKLQVLLPGETAAPGSASGKTGTPAAQTAGAAFTVTVNAVDANWNLIDFTQLVSLHTVGITSSDGNATLPTNAVLVAGTQTFTVTLKTAGSQTVTATDISDGTKTANTSPATTVNGGTFTKLQLLMPGETAAPGSATGKTGSPTSQTVGTPLNVTVNAVDAYWNAISTNDTVQLTSSDNAAVLPADAALSGGTGVFAVTLRTSGVQTVTASDVTHPGIAAATGSATTVIAGPQTITFNSPGDQTNGVAPITLTATASSGLIVSYSVIAGPATVTANVLTITGGGSVTIQASQTGDTNWNAATPVNQTIMVSQAVLFTENFDYPAGELHGQNGGSGFSGAWSAQTTNSEIVNASLSYSMPGGGVVMGGTKAVQLTNNFDSLASRALTYPASGPDVYLSFLIQLEAGSINDGDFAALWFNPSAGPNAGFKGNGGDGSTTADLMVRPRFDINAGAYQQNLVVGQTHFVVARFSKSGVFPGLYDRATIWVDPSIDPVASANVSFTADQSVNLIGTITNIGLRTANLETGDKVLFDAITFADNWQDVVSALSVPRTSNAVTSSANPALPGSNITSTATLSLVLPGSGTPTGDVIFKDGTTVLGTNALNGSAEATFSTTALAHGSHTITAEYAGDGNFFGSTNSLVQVVNTPPLAPIVIIERAAGVSYRLRIANLLTNCSDADGDSFFLAGVGSSSTNGAAITTNATFIFYTPPPMNGNVTDALSYTVGDGFGAATGTLVLTIKPASTNQTHNIISLTLTTNNAVILEIAGIPNRSYLVQATTNLATPIWQTIGTNVAGTNGLFTFFDPDAVNWPSRWYRTATQ